MALFMLRKPFWAAVLSCSSRIPTRMEPQSIVLCVDGRRWAAVRSQGKYKMKPRNTHPKKYGAKRSGDQYVVPGNIIFTQKGTKWYAGENTHMGRNHTIHATVAGYVKYYKDPSIHPGRQYIGVTFEREDTLPYPRQAVRKRRLNRTLQPIPPPKEEPEPGQAGPSGIPETVVQRIGARPDQVRVLRLQPNYSYREDNYSLGKSVGDVSNINNKGYKSRRLAMRMRRAKQERRHMRLRHQLRSLIKERREGRKKKMHGKMIMLQRRGERAQKTAYKSLIEQGKAPEEATEIVGPRMEFDPIWRAKLELLRSDNYGKNRGAARKQLPRIRWEEDNLQAAAEKMVKEENVKFTGWRVRQDPSLAANGKGGQSTSKSKVAPPTVKEDMVGGKMPPETEAKTEPEAEVKAKAKTEANPKPKAPKAESKADHKVQEITQAKVEPKRAPKAEGRAEPMAEVKTEPKKKVKAEAKTAAAEVKKAASAKESVSKGKLPSGEKE